MMMTVYAQAVEQGAIQLWVGLFGTESPPLPQFVIDRQAVAPATVLTPMTPIRDRQTGPGGQPFNHRGIYRFAVTDAGVPHRVEVTAGTEQTVLSVMPLPEQVPSGMGESFNILLCSCYSQPDDAAGLLGTIVSQIKVQPNLTLMAGDQVYLDLPLFEDLPEDEPALSQAIGNKYMRNWASQLLRVPGLQQVLTRAPVVNIADDHEFWNNYPYPQKQLPNTWREGVRNRWRDAARALYEDYQLAVAPDQAGATRLDVVPLKMLFLDMRVDRDDQFSQLMNARALAALHTWRDDLMADHAAGKPTAGMLSSGQALFIDPPKEDSKKRDVDAEMGNYAQFAEIEQVLTDLSDQDIPVVYVTGDVHWGRVASATDQVKGRKSLYEIIASPSRLIRTPGLDTAKEAGNALKGIFGQKDPWPRHSDAEKPPDRFGPARRFKLQCEYPHKGDQVAIVSFTRAGAGIDFQVSYYGIHTDKSISQSRTVGPFPLRQM